MEPYQERVLDEQSDLLAKIEKLEAFIAGLTFPNLPGAEKNLLRSQVGYMNQYNLVLQARISLWNL